MGYRTSYNASCATVFLDSSSDSLPSIPLQGSDLFDDKKKSEKGNQVKKAKKPKELKSLQGSGKKAKSPPKIAKSRPGEELTADGYCEIEENENMRDGLKKKKKGKRIIVFSEDEDDEQEKEDIRETGSWIIKIVKPDLHDTLVPCHCSSRYMLFSYKSFQEALQHSIASS